MPASGNDQHLDLTSEALIRRGARDADPAHFLIPSQQGASRCQRLVERAGQQAGQAT